MMGRILAIDYGNKRVGLAVTDELQIIASGLTTIHAKDIFPFLTDYIARENIELIVVGEPLDMLSRPSDAAKFVEPFVKQLKKRFPGIPVERMDERFTSKLAASTIREAGKGKKDRQNKSLIDTVSATIILQSFMEKRTFTRNRQ